MNHLDRLSFCLDMWTHLGRYFFFRSRLALFIHSKIRVSNFLDATRDTSPEDQISRLLARSSRHMSHLISTTSCMNERHRRKIACQWFDISYYGACCSSIFCCKGWIAASLIHFQGWRSPTCCCRDDARPATMKEGSIWSPCEPVLHAHCRSVAVDHRVLMCTCLHLLLIDWTCHSASDLCCIKKHIIWNIISCHNKNIYFFLNRNINYSLYTSGA